MKKFIPCFFIFLFIPFWLAAQNIIIHSGHFSSDKQLIRLIKRYIKNHEEIKNKANKYFYQNGYIFTRVTEIKTEKKALHVYLDDGKIRIFKILGIRKISFNIIKNYLYFKEGDIFNKKQLRMQIKKLYNLDLFDSITYKISENKKWIIVKIIEKKPWFWELNGGYSAQYGIMPYLGFVNRNVFRQGIYMNINASCGYYKELNFYQFNSSFIIHHIFLDLTYRKGKTFIYENDYSSEQEKVKIGTDLFKNLYYRLIFIVPLENYNFYDTENFSDLIIINGLRTGLGLQFIYSDRRNVLDIREETFLKIYTASLVCNTKDNYQRLELDYKTFNSLFWDINMVYRNNSGYIWGRIPFDQLLLIGGATQRGYREGEYITDQKLENGLEIEYEIFFDILKIVLFTDTSYFKNSNNYKFLISYGPGLIINVLNFNIQAFFGIPADKDPASGNFYITANKIIY